MKNTRKTSIICTIGPASEDRIKEMIKAGMNVARINFSHGGKEEHSSKIEKIKKARKELNAPISILLDTQGPEIRLGLLDEKFKNGIVVREGEALNLKNTEELGTDKFVVVSYKELYKDVKPGMKILVDDGAVELEVVKIDGETIKTVVKNDGIIKERKSLNVPGAKLKLPTLKEKDKQDILYGIEADLDYIAASFTRNKEDIIEIREFLKANGGEEIKIIAKVENQEAIEKIDEIIEYSDGIMIARGDLAVEVPFTQVPILQKQIIARANKAGKPVIVATQMLDSMINNPLPTRAEASDVANAVFDRTTAIMLSGETAVGKYPLQCISIMDTISKNVEGIVNYEKSLNTLDQTKFQTLDEKITLVTAKTASMINTDAVIAYAKTGATVRKLSSTGMSIPIFVVTSNEKTFNQLGLSWNIIPMLVPEKETITKTLDYAIEVLKEEKRLLKGQTVYLTGGREFLESSSENKRIGGIAII